jgi:hypothetical protein
MSSRRHEQAEREAIEEVVTDYAKLAGVVIALSVACLVLGGPWAEFKEHGHQWGWALLGVVDDLIGAAILAAIIAVKVGEAKQKNAARARPTTVRAPAPPNRSVQVFEERAQRVAATTIELRDIDDVLLRSRVKKIRERRV